MIKVKLKMKSKTVGQIVRSMKEKVTVLDFIQLHEKVFRDKGLEVLSLRTMHDHEMHFYFSHHVELLSGIVEGQRIGTANNSFFFVFHFNMYFVTI